ncbi:hypothetical protein ATM17_30735 (plasmid) [Sphingopyxis macrogoltabida]|uniref:Uncharacterized protein n=1 Tax=Sphingopyxis macrogoltabida TaxID=33050 RepID=A0AAC9FHJ2_SPHMC|nr:hypothetical protein LH19_26740 [Sphingopyxis macrogoltabida]AMU92636.1 hypothetical protein ATM17_30735 [Sphingopyxis macrogoltabida]
MVTRLEEETRIGKGGTLAAQLSRLDLVVLDRVIRHCDIVETGNDSWRSKNGSRPPPSAPSKIYLALRAAILDKPTS